VPMIRLARTAMATRVELVLGGPDERRLRAAGEEALDELEHWAERLSLYRRDGLLGHLHRTAADRPVPVDDDVWSLLETIDAIARASGRAFDPVAAAAAKGASGSMPPGMDVGAVMPGDSELDERPRPNWSDVELDGEGRTVRFVRADVRLDLGGIAKGFVLDRAADVLRGAGIERALLHGGTSSVVAIGAPPGRAAWQVAVRDPTEPDQRQWPVVELRDEALGVSAPHGRVEAGIGHVLDPRRCASVPVGSMAAAIAPSAVTADGWSTALLVLGRRPPACPATVRSFAGPDRDERFAHRAFATP